ncbi:CHRD domain-containing protein [Hymenobacter gelipurpurascens]|uniref:CHRD domain-containing protein n=1 Tax=Hymenobacter gelipurpurascens TaxID=89968 RepID=A0A212UAN3_9BACT|nr:CHRD domain-containing protein [Hymenobacter gelipurpurascens]SNC75352.1 CHRD domain-containing protein [Hymenobacter gelipurpurascens]
MKTNLFRLFMLLFVVAAVPACNDDDDDNNNPTPSTTVQLQATLNAQQEVPATPSAATGTMTGSFDKVTRLLTYTVTYQGITPSAGHIHQAAPGVNGPIIVPFASVATSPISGTATLSEADAVKLLAGETYTNLHTPAFPGGEIRGNITVK